MNHLAPSVLTESRKYGLNFLLGIARADRSDDAAHGGQVRAQRAQDGFQGIDSWVMHVGGLDLGNDPWRDAGAAGQLALRPTTFLSQPLDITTEFGSISFLRVYSA